MTFLSRFDVLIAHVVVRLRLRKHTAVTWIKDNMENSNNLEEQFVDMGILSVLQRKCWKTAEDHGWHDQEPLVVDGEVQVANVGLKLALVHSELSEALEALRRGELMYYEEQGKPEGFGVELADAVIRILDMAESLGINIQSCLKKKNAYNETRSYRHGGKKA
jgi:hypothetical protein